jgi:hypothetical protein
MKNSTQLGSVKGFFCRFLPYAVDMLLTGNSSSPVLLILVVLVREQEFKPGKPNFCINNCHSDFLR